jgi:putative phage-type endonuclease
MNCKVLCKTSDIDRKEWQRQRQRGIGGSDIGAILGKNPYKSALQVYADKLDGIEGVFEQPSEEQQERMDWGNLLEPVVATAYTTKTKNKLIKVNAILQHPLKDFALANIDRLILSAKPGILEIKTTGWPGEWEQGIIPDHYLLQLHWYLMITGLEYGQFATLIRGQKLVTPEPILRDDELCGYMMEAGEQFWQSVMNKIPPMIDGSKAGKEVIKKLFNQASCFVSVALPAEAHGLIQEVEYAKADLEKAQYKKDAAENRLKQILSENESGYIDQYVVSWKNSERKSLDTEALKRDGLYDKYIKTTTSRTFSIKEKKEKKNDTNRAA